jgi:hypothetical protein
VQPGLLMHVVFCGCLSSPQMATHPKDQSFYLTGLKAMLAEMRARRPPNTPFGHTQQLRPQFYQGARLGKVGWV